MLWYLVSIELIGNHEYFIYSGWKDALLQYIMTALVFVDSNQVDSLMTRG